MINSISSRNFIQLHTSRDVLATIPQLLGYRPANSLILLTTHPGAGTSTLRLNLPDSNADARAVNHFTATVARMARRIPGVRSSILAVFTNEPWTDHPPLAAVVDAVADRLRGNDLIVTDTLAHTPTGWGQYARPRVKHALALLEHPVAGDDDAPRAASSLAELAAIPSASNAERREFSRAIAERHGRTLLRDVGRPVDVAGLTEEALTAGHPTASELGGLFSLVIADETSRDEVIATLAWGADRGRQMARASAIDLVLFGQGATVRPDPARIRDAIALITRVVALTVDPHHRAVALTLLAWLHWSQGAGSIASLLLDHADHYDPHYTLAGKLASAVDRGRLPNWVFDEPPEVRP